MEEGCPIGLLSRGVGLGENIVPDWFYDLAFPNNAQSMALILKDMR